MAKIGTMTLSGKSGSKYEFAVYPRATTFKALGALYFMTKRTLKPEGGGSHAMIYVGETSDLSNRPLNHHRKQCFDRKGADTVCILVESDRDRRLAIETDLRQNYDPPCNRQ